MKRVRTAAAAVLAALVTTVAAVPEAAAMPDPAPRGADYVSLGDSFVALGSRTTTNGKPCEQASDNVGRLVAAQLPGLSFGDWACGAAGTADITSGVDKGPQVRGLGPNTRFVSISIGGNDDDFFTELVENCLVAITCTPEIRQRAQDKLDRLGPRLDVAYAAVRAAAPRAKVVVLGYLMVVPPEPAGCPVAMVIGPDGVALARQAQERLNDEIAGAAARAGFTMVNRQQPAGHTICGADGQRWVSLTGALPGEEGTPVHPTLAGRRHAAKLIATAFHQA